MIQLPTTFFTATNLTSKTVNKIQRTIKDLTGIYKDEAAFSAEDTNKKMYEVATYLPVAEGTEGGLFFGITYLQPGLIGNEYYMTKGHFHTIENRAEYYWCIEGKGMLILMDKDRNTWGEAMQPGSLHYIKGFTAHRVANTENDVLIFGACWPSDAGHDYEAIAKNGFSKRLFNINGIPALQ